MFGVLFRACYPAVTLNPQHEPKIVISLCPDVAIDFPGRERVIVPSGKPALLLLRLALTPNRSYGRDYLVQCLWPECDSEVGRPRLRFTLTVLRNSLGLADVLVPSKNEVGLDWSKVETDVERFRRGISRAEGQLEALERASILISACKQISGGLAEQQSASWLAGSRAEILNTRIDALARAAALYMEAGELKLAEAALREAIVLDPLRESLQNAIMELLGTQDRVAEALTIYETFRLALQRDLGLIPSDPLAAVARGLTRSSPKREETSRDGQVAQRPFFGREELVQLVEAAVGQTPLVTLIGLGGAGKTRLATEIYRNHTFTQGRFVDLSDATSEADVNSAVHAAYDVRVDDRQALYKKMRSVGGLLVLDNCEQVLEAARELVTRVGIEAPSIRILATTRKQLGAQGELVFEVPGLSVPEEGEGSSIEDLRESPSIGLFLQAAMTASQEFTLNSESAAEAVKLVRAVDGLPLSIELAAARLRLMPLSQLLEMLSQGLDILSSRHRPLRQRRVSDIVEWSISGLSEPARLLLDRLAVFASGWDMVAATTLGVHLGIGAVDALDELLDHSLVSRMPDHRFRLLESIRLVALQHLRSADLEEATRDAHLRGYLSIYEPHKDWTTSPDNATWRRRIQADLANMRLALQWAATREHEEQLGERLACSIWRYWATSGLMMEGYRLLRGLVEAHPDQPRNAVYADLLSAISRFEMRQGKFEDAWGTQNEALEISRALGDEPAQGLAMRNLAEIAIQRRAHEEAQTIFEKALTLFRRFDDSFGAGVCLDGIGRSYSHRNEHRDAVMHFEAALALMVEHAKKVGDPALAAPQYNNLGDSLLALGEFDRARDCFCNALNLAEQAGDQVGQAVIIANLGSIAIEAGDVVEARRLYTQGLTLRKSIGEPRSVGRGEVQMGLVSFAEGNMAEAEVWFKSAITRLDEIGEEYEASIPRLWLADTCLARGQNKYAIGVAQRALAAIAKDTGTVATAHALLTSANVLIHGKQYHGGALLIGASEAARSGHGTATPRLEGELLNRAVAMATSALGDDFQAIRSSGQWCSEAQGLEYAYQATADMEGDVR